MESLISKWFTRFINEKGNYLPLSEQNRQLLTNELAHCYSTSDISLLREVLRLCVEDFTTLQHLEFELNISYRLHLILHCNRNFKNQIFDVYQIRQFYKNTDSYAICDAIALHIEMNRESYQKVVTDYSIFSRMEVNRKFAILEKFQNKKSA
jgi:hypothetical protein